MIQLLYKTNLNVKKRLKKQFIKQKNFNKINEFKRLTKPNMHRIKTKDNNRHSKTNKMLNRLKEFRRLFNKKSNKESLRRDF